MPVPTPLSVKTISEFHQLRGLPAPAHPLISVIAMGDFKHTRQEQPLNIHLGFYSISVKRGFNGKMRYGQQTCDFDDGIMFFMAPGQVFSILTGPDRPQSGYMLLAHPDFIWNTPLAKQMGQYEFFDYAVNEALFLSDKEEGIISGILKNIEQESRQNIDKFSQQIIVSYIQTLLNYSDRFYHRQFITRKKSNNQILARLEEVLSAYFANSDLTAKGLPGVQYIADQLNLSPNYLSGVLKSLTGQSTQQHIHNKLIDQAKAKLSTTNYTVSEIAYQLGFEHAQSFSKLFKAKTNLSPLQFRASFN